jgi:ferredoxin-nitrate reductase
MSKARWGWGSTARVNCSPRTTYTLALVVRCGIGTPHLDANTRLCTATAGAVLKETFETDGAPGSLSDFDSCDTIFEVGHNAAETHTVLWTRTLDRLQGPDRPRLVIVDPRRTKVADEADVHLPIRNGTNLALLNALQHDLIEHSWVDQRFIDAHTVGFAELADTVKAYPLERAAEICGVPADDIRTAARIIGEAQRLVSSCLQGVYQSHQAAASAARSTTST